MFEDVNWDRRGPYMEAKHHVTSDQANEALRDPDRVLIIPDYASHTGRTCRVIGYSHAADTLLSIIVLEDEGVEYGVNGWVSNTKDRRIYREGAIQ